MVGYYIPLLHGPCHEFCVVVRVCGMGALLFCGVVALLYSRNRALRLAMLQRVLLSVSVFAGVCLPYSTVLDLLHVVATCIDSTAVQYLLFVQLYSCTF